VLGKANRSLSVNSNRCIPVKNTLGLSSVVFCACDVTQLISVVFCDVRAVNKMDLRHIMNEIPDKYDQVKESHIIDSESFFFCCMCSQICNLLMMGESAPETC
jgi:hypothetical protein